MASFTIVNRTTNNIHLVVPYGDGKYSTAILIPASCAIDILPIAGSVSSCKLTCGLRNLEARGFIEIICEE